MYTATYGGSIENAAPEPVLPMVIACVCAPAAAIATECVCAPELLMLSQCEWVPVVLVQPVHEREAAKPGTLLAFARPMSCILHIADVL